MFSLKFFVFVVVLCSLQLKAAGFGCRKYCYLRCGWLYCRWRCGFRCSGKRGISSEDDVGEGGQLPQKFGVYDVNGDGRITLEELAKVTRVKKNAKGTKIAFGEADRNRDGYIDCEEFKRAPFLFAHRPTCAQ